MIRVTEPLNYFKEQWYIDWVHKVGRTEANKISKRSMKIGTEVDSIIKQNINGVYLMNKFKSAEVGNCIEAYKKWSKIYQPKSISACTRISSIIEEQEVSGEPDIIVDDVIVDIKCSSNISKSYWIQVNMYHYLMKPKFPMKVGILRLDKITSSFEYVVKEYDPFLVSVWCGLMRAMVYLKGDKNGGFELQ